MRILFNGTGHPQNIAKAIKRSLATRGIEIGLRRCEEIFAKMTGYANWHELRIVSARIDVMSPLDEHAGAEAASNRREQFVHALAGHAGVDRDTAEEVVDQIRPMGRRQRASENHEISGPAASGKNHV
jgi:hypothetical protein